MKTRCAFFIVALSILCLSVLSADSGGKLIREQAAYDALFYNLNLKIDPSTQSIAGFTIVRAAALDTLSHFVLDLNMYYLIDSIVWNRGGKTLLSYQFTNGRIWIALPHPVAAGDTLEVAVWYHGVPKVSQDPPWDDGFVWKTTKSGQSWAGVACESEGGDLWWPCKDHPSDEPDSVSLNFTVPANLVCVSNGRLIDSVDDHNGWKTFQWFVSNPINNYCVTFYLGPFVRVPVNYTSITGEPVPSEYWFLPEDVDSIVAYTPVFLDELHFLEKTCGPFPFRADKYGLCDAPYYGMENQTIIAYGNNFHLNSFGFDYIHLHEVSHEWWGNLVTAKDWSDIWLHEGFACYMEALCAEYLHGSESYHNYMSNLHWFSNFQAVAPPETLTESQSYNGDVYDKGAWILHTLRHLIGDSTFFRLLHRWSYPDTAMEHVTNGKQCRLATTDDFLHAAENISGMDLTWFFNVYLRQPALPKLASGVVDSTLYLRWDIPNGLPFPLPVEVRLDTAIVKVSMTGGSAQLAIPHGVQPVIDPDHWILMDLTPPLSASPLSLWFGSVMADSTRIDSVVLTNQWIAPITITSDSSDMRDYRVTPSQATIPVLMSQKFYVTFTPDTVGMRIGHILFNYNASGSPVSVFAYGGGLMPSSTYSFSQSWNIVSVPLRGFNPYPGSLFPDAVSPAFGYTPGIGYAMIDSLRAGSGYWLRFAADQVVTIPGLTLATDTISVSTGWNLIGSVTFPVLSKNIGSDPPGLATSFLFGYHDGYVISDTIVPGRGYWIKVNQDGKLILTSHPSACIHIALLSEVPPPPPGHAPGTTLPKNFALEEAYPNPFNPTATIRYALPSDSRVSISIYNLLGQLMETLTNDIEPAGFRQAVWNASNFASGVYFCRVEAVSVNDPDRSFTGVKKLLLLR